MSARNPGMAIILHSGSFDRLKHALSLAQTALALGREVSLFFTYWSLPYLKKEPLVQPGLNEEASFFESALKKDLTSSYKESIVDLLHQTKELGAKIYVCSNSLSILNIRRDELISEVDRSMGLTTFLASTSNDQILFI